MKLDSPLFNRIRVKPEEDRTPRPNAPLCQWSGCTHEATHRAPKGRNRERDYWRFCLEHVRDYNHSYNYFSGMSDDAVLAYQKDAVTGHRPTWKMGFNGGGAERMFGREQGPHDPFDVVREFGPGGRPPPQPPPPPAPAVPNAARKASRPPGPETGPAGPPTQAALPGARQPAPPAP